MNNLEKLIIAGVSAFGPRWQTDIAAALGVSDRTVRNWLSKKYAVPSTIPAELVSVLACRKAEIEDAMKLLVQESENITSILDAPGVVSMELAYSRAHLIAQNRQTNSVNTDYDTLYEEAFRELMADIELSGFQVKN